MCIRDRFQSGREFGGGGGVSIYCNDQLTVNCIDNLCYVTDYIECCTVKIKINSRTIFVIAVYRPPGGSLDTFNENMIEILNDSSLRNCEIVVLGDFNINLINYHDSNINVRNFVLNMFSHHYISVISKPTRFPCGDQHGVPSLLDHTWYNRTGANESGILIFDNTDHLPTFVIMKCG